jgi:hypothetical protein
MNKTVESLVFRVRYEAREQRDYKLGETDIYTDLYQLCGITGGRWIHGQIVSTELPWLKRYAKLLDSFLTSAEQQGLALDKILFGFPVKVSGKEARLDWDGGDGVFLPMSGQFIHKDILGLIAPPANVEPIQTPDNVLKGAIVSICRNLTWSDCEYLGVGRESQMTHENAVIFSGLRDSIGDAKQEGRCCLLSPSTHGLTRHLENYSIQHYKGRYAVFIQQVALILRRYKFSDREAIYDLQGTETLVTTEFFEEPGNLASFWGTEFAPTSSGGYEALQVLLAEKKAGAVKPKRMTKGELRAYLGEDGFVGQKTRLLPALSGGRGKVVKKAKLNEVISDASLSRDRLIWNVSCGSSVRAIYAKLRLQMALDQLMVKTEFFGPHLRKFLLITGHCETLRLYFYRRGVSTLKISPLQLAKCLVQPIGLAMRRVHYEVVGLALIAHSLIGGIRRRYLTTDLRRMDASCNCMAEILDSVVNDNSLSPTDKEIVSNDLQGAPVIAGGVCMEPFPMRIKARGRRTASLRTSGWSSGHKTISTGESLLRFASNLIITALALRRQRDDPTYTTATQCYRGLRPDIEAVSHYVSVLVNGDDDILGSAVWDLLPASKSQLIKRPQELKAYMEKLISDFKNGIKPEVMEEESLAEAVFTQLEFKLSHYQAGSPLVQSKEKGTEGGVESFVFNSAKTFEVTMKDFDGIEQTVMMASPMFIRRADYHPVGVEELDAFADKLCYPDRVLRHHSETILRLIGQIPLAVDHLVYNTYLMLVKKVCEKNGVGEFRLQMTNVAGEENRSFYQLQELGILNEVVERGETEVTLRIPSYARVMEVHGFKIRPEVGFDHAVGHFFRSFSSLGELETWPGVKGYDLLRGELAELNGYGEDCPP